MLAASQAVNGSFLATPNTRTRFPLRALPNRVSAKDRSYGTLRRVAARPGVPLTPHREQVTEQDDLVGHDPVGAEVKDPLHLVLGVDRPHVHLQPGGLRP